MKKPTILIPMGDPAGIGPEIVIKALASPQIAGQANCLVIGDKGIMALAMKYPNIPQMELRVVAGPEEIDPGTTNTLYLMDLHNIDLASFRVGEVSAACGQAAFEYIKTSIELAMAGRGDAVATPPINKVSLHMSGLDYIGHTEIFAELTNTQDPLTMFQVNDLRIFFLTRHVSLRQACDLITTERIVDYGHRCQEALRQIGLEDGCMAIAGLNPHSGEHGLFGDEEDREIVPAVEQLTREGFNVVGPIGADSVFHLAMKGRYNSVLSLYHDQGHIAAKTYDFEKTISLTLGMPILRTSVDHGTAMDIAGTGLASEVSMVEAIRLAVLYAPFFKKEAVISHE